MIDGRVSEEWTTLFTQVLNEHGKGAVFNPRRNNYFEQSTNKAIDKAELLLILKSFLDNEFVEQIGFDL